MGQLSSGHQTEKFSPAPRHCQHRSSHCPLCVIMFSLKALAVVLTVASLAEAHSSPQKRETTVTFEGTYEDVRQLVINIVLAFTLATILVVVAPIFGYKFDLIVSPLDDLGADEAALTSPEAVDPSYGGYAGYSEPQAGTGQGYRMLPGGSSLASLSALGARVLNSIDLLDMAFNYMDIEDETCRMKTICQAENYAVNHPVARLAINTLNSSLRGLEKYQDAVSAGQRGEDCRLLYDQCPGSYFGLEF